MNTDQIISQIVPPADYQHRNGFNNIPILEKLSIVAKQEVEKALIEKLKLQPSSHLDGLIIETLGYLKSERSLTLLNDLLGKEINDTLKLLIAATIFEINSDDKMVDIAIEAFNKMDNKKDSYYVYKLTSAFYDLLKIDHQKTIHLVSQYINHSEYLISYNARRALELKKKDAAI